MEKRELREIKFGDLVLNDKVDEYWQKIKETNWVSSGPLVEEFEQKFGNLFYTNAVAVSTGTDADICALLTLYETHNAKLGDEIICPALCFFSVASSIIAAGFKPVFVDIDPHTLNIDPYKIEEKITNKTRAILAVNTMGKPVDIPVLNYITKKHKIALIIDNCEGHGCMYLEDYMETYADIVTYSCYQAHLVQSVEFGFCCTNDEYIADLLRCIRTHGRENGKRTFNHIYLGYNSKPTDLHAMIGLSQIGNFWKRFNDRTDNVRTIRDGLRGYEKYMMFSEEDDNYINSPHAFSVTLIDQNIEMNTLFKQHLTNHGIDWKINFKCIPSQQLSMINLLGYKPVIEKRYPMAEWVGNCGVHFGCHEHMTYEDCEYVTDVIKEFFDKKENQ